MNPSVTTVDVNVAPFGAGKLLGLFDSFLLRPKDTGSARRSGTPHTPLTALWHYMLALLTGHFVPSSSNHCELNLNA